MYMTSAKYTVPIIVGKKMWNEVESETNEGSKGDKVPLGDIEVPLTETVFKT